MNDLVQWLSKQLDEDERIARAIEDEEQQWNPGDKNLGSAVIGAEYGAAVVVGPYDYLDWSVREHIAAHDPARVLREIDAKRQILALHTPFRVDGDPWPGCNTCSWRDEMEDLRVQWPCPTLRLLAMPYVDRPGYEEGWRP